MSSECLELLEEAVEKQQDLVRITNDEKWYTKWGDYDYASYAYLARLASEKCKFSGLLIYNIVV